MDSTAFVAQLQNEPYIDPNDNVLDTIMAEYERVILHSLITSFGLDFLVQDQHGGDVDTIHNVRKIASDPEMKYKNAQNLTDYYNRGEYDSDIYHKDQAYKETNKKYSGSLKMKCSNVP